MTAAHGAEPQVTAAHGAEPQVTGPTIGRATRPRLLDEPVSSDFAAAVEQFGGSRALVDELRYGAAPVVRPRLSRVRLTVAVLAPVAAGGYGCLLGTAAGWPVRLAWAALAAGYAAAALRLAVSAGRLARRSRSGWAPALRTATAWIAWGAIGASAVWIGADRGVSLAAVVATAALYAATGAFLAVDAHGQGQATSPGAAATDTKAVALAGSPLVRPSSPPARTSPVQDWLRGRRLVPVAAACAVLALVLGGSGLVRWNRQGVIGAVGGSITAEPTTGAGHTVGGSITAEPTTGAGHTVGATDSAPDPAVAHQQATAVDALLAASVNSRRELNAAIDMVNRCTTLQDAVAGMRAAEQERQSQLTTLRDTDLSAIPTGSALRDLLAQALQYSQQTDASFAAWAQGAVDGGCQASAQRDRDFAEAQRLSGLAAQAKASFLTAWNPVAAANGVATRTPDDI